MQRLIVSSFLVGTLLATGLTHARPIVRVYQIYSPYLHRYVRVWFFYEKIECSGNTSVNCPITVGGAPISGVSISCDGLEESNEHILTLWQAIRMRIEAGELQGRVVLSLDGSAFPGDRLAIIDGIAQQMLSTPNYDPNLYTQLEAALQGYPVGIGIWRYDTETRQLDVVLVVNPQ